MTTRTTPPELDTTNWRDLSACSTHYGPGPMPWDHDAPPADRADAIRICRTECPVRTQCRQWATVNKPDGGVWAGIDLNGIELPDLEEGIPA